MRQTEIHVAGAVPDSADWASAVAGGPPQLSARWLTCHAASFDRPSEYAIAYVGGRPAAAAVFHVRFDTDHHTKYRLSNLQPGCRSAEPSLVVVAPSSYVSGLHVACGVAAREAGFAVRALVAELRRRAADAGATTLLFPHIADPAPGWLREEVAEEGALFPMSDSAYLDLRRISTFDDYLATLPAKRKRETARERRAFTAAGLSVEVAGEVPITPALLERQVAHYRRHGLEADRERVAGQFLALQKDYAGRLHHVTVLRDGAEAIGHVLAVEEGEWLIPKLAGFTGREGFGYFEATYYTMIDLALRSTACERIDYGGAAIEAKVRRGCRIRPLQGALLSTT
ncbi:peptidogalycan biosysnthesis protein [Sinosporangium siamense]|uniref:GNAT family N-acetyltransferase n=1 Tax=Sinosporangium siamense TaxID=1367973 RepID=A0A919RIP8_9ACTN|nr:peptidogalycan biosysnthesis protein [Sinosporangium siamense]GII94600.1 hypothetical protein Ssi02_48310 [Sinosporangium siamense]